jgi:hypothetical protein
MCERTDGSVAAPDRPAHGNELRQLREDAMSFGVSVPQYSVKGRDI